MDVIPPYPDSCPIHLNLRPAVHEQLRILPEGVSEFTFANLYLFRDRHQYRLSMLPKNLITIIGKDADQTFFMLPFGLPDAQTLSRLFTDQKTIKGLTVKQKEQLSQMGYTVVEDRDNFDYLYSRTDLAELHGRKFSKKTQPG